MQGADTGPAVTGALAALTEAGVDVVAIVRGGGSRLDLSWFDKEDVVRAIAGCSIPVLTGIGHEIDISVSDAVSHQSFKTPTAVAEFLAGRARDALRAVEDSFLSICSLAELVLVDGRRDLLESGRAIQHAVGERLRVASQELAAIGPAVITAARDRLTGCHHDLVRATDRLARGPHIDELRRRADRLAEDGRRLTWRVENRLGEHEAALVAAADRLRLLDPTSVLRRGYAWLRRADGGALMDAATAVPGNRVTAVVRDGEIDMTIETSRPTREPRSNS